MILIPGTSHVITWSKQNLLDGTTYYVQAVIRDVREDTILATINLTDQGGGRFTGVWNVVGDPSGQGREIEVQKTIYEDSGYSNVSAVYGRWLDRYTVFDLSARVGGGGGFGGSVDYSVIERIIERKFSGITKMLEEKYKIDLGPLTELVGEVGTTRKTFLEKMQELFRIKSRADQLEEVEARAVAAMNDLKSSTTKATKDIYAAAESAIATIKQAVDKSVDNLTRSVNEKEKSLSRKTDGEMTYIVSQFKAIMEHEAEKLSSKVVSDIDETLKKPLKIQSVQEHNLVRDGEKKDRANDARAETVRRLIDHGKL